MLPGLIDERRLVGRRDPVQVGDLEGLPMPRLAVRLVEGVAPVGEHGPVPHHELSHRREQRLEVGVGQVLDGVVRDPKMGRLAVGLRIARRQEQADRQHER